MAKLGSSVDARLSRISPYATSAILQGGASMGAGYSAVGAGLGKAITSIMHQIEESRIDEILNEALMPQEPEMQTTPSVIGEFTSPADMQRKPIEGTGHQPYTPVLDSEGKPTTYSQLDEKAIRRFLSDKKVFGRNISEKRIASFLKQERDSINSNNTTQISLAALEDQQETNRANRQLAEEKETTRQAEVEAGILRDKGYQEERMGVIRQTRDTQQKLLDQQIIETEAAVAELAAGTAERTATAEGRKAEEKMFDKFRIQLERGRAIINNPESTQEDYAKVQTDLRSLLNTYGLATSQETLAMAQLEATGELIMDEKLDLDDQINAAANAFYADTTQVELFDQKRADDPQALLATMLTLLEDPNIKTEKLEKLYTLLNQDVRNKAAARKSLGLNGGNPPPAPVTQTSASGNTTYPGNYIWPWFRKEGVPYLGAPTIGETQMGQAIHSWLTPDQDK